MAINRKALSTRSLTGIFFVVVMLAGLLVNHWTFFVLFSLIHLGCWLEYFKLISAINPDYGKLSPLHRMGFIGLGWSFMMWITPNSTYLLGLDTLHGVGYLLILVFAILILASELVFPKKIGFRALGYSLLGLLYISLPLSLMVSLRNPLNFFVYAGPQTYCHIQDLSVLLPLVLVVSIWFNDTFAYLTGSLIGRHHFSKISPNKTMEGIIGGIIFSVVLVPVLFKLLVMIPAAFSIWNIIFIALIASVVGTLGDLLESKIKRMASVKDSGTFFPGHGGFLDRFDSLLLASPFVWLYLYFFLRF